MVPRQILEDHLLRLRGVRSLRGVRWLRSVGRLCDAGTLFWANGILQSAGVRVRSTQERGGLVPCGSLGVEVSRRWPS